jgi:hypothetical protein
MTSKDEEAVRIAIRRDIHQQLVETRPYEETLREWSSYVIAEGLHAVEAQREEDQE